MLFAFFGTDTIKVRKAALDVVHIHEKKGASPVFFTPHNYVAGSIEDAVGGASLFGGTQIFVIDTPSGDLGMFEAVFQSLNMLKESANIFILIEGKLLAPEKKKLEKYGDAVTELQGIPKAAFNSFSLADALVSRDKKTLWVLLLRAKREGLSGEELVGTLFWQLKALRLAAKAKGIEETGLKPFVYQKAKRALTQFKDGELEKLSDSLVSLYHDGHSGVRDLDIALERWVLAL